MKKNYIRTSSEIATLASQILSARKKSESDLLKDVLDEITLKAQLEEVAASLAGSALSNRRK